MTEETAGSPRTDGLIRSIASIEDRYLPLRNLARQLEREVAALTTQRDEQTKESIFWGEETKRWKREYNGCLVRAEAAEAELDELQKRIGDTAEPVAEGGANLDDSLRMQGLMWAVLLIAEAHAKNGLALDKAVCDEARQFLENRLATGTAQATECETNETEGLRAELDAAKRALAGESLETTRARFEQWFKTNYPLFGDRGDTTLKHKLWTCWQVAALAAKSPLG